MGIPCRQVSNTHKAKLYLQALYVLGCLGPLYLGTPAPVSNDCSRLNV